MTSRPKGTRLKDCLIVLTWRDMTWQQETQKTQDRLTAGSSLPANGLQSNLTLLWLLATGTWVRNRERQHPCVAQLQLNYALGHPRAAECVRSWAGDVRETLLRFHKGPSVSSTKCNKHSNSLRSLCCQICYHAQGGLASWNLVVTDQKPERSPHYLN